MPLHSFDQMDGEVVLWEITESESVLSEMTNGEVCPPTLTHPKKRKEWLAGRLLVRRLAQKEQLYYKGIEKNHYGKPFLKDCSHHISLSHSFPYVTAQIHVSHSVGIDVEQPHKKLLKIAPRVLSGAELQNAGEDIIKLCVYWCAKEAFFKEQGKKGISFLKHMRIDPFVLLDKGDLTGSITVEDHEVITHLCYVVHPRFVVVYSNTRV